jgi:hypothetical protein
MRALADHIHLAVIGEDIVLLDTRSDAYLCIPDGVAHLRPQPDRAHLAATPEASAALASSGFLAQSGLVAARTVPSRPTLNLCFTAQVRPTLRDARRLGLAVADLLILYRGRDLGRIIDFTARSQPAGVPIVPQGPIDGELQRLALVFHGLAPWLPMPRKCLIRSFVLLRFLQRSGQRADWVFGVATWPFSAHCWIQSGDWVLDDHWERLLVFEPILAVR